jgi:hypothetical protein
VKSRGGLFARNRFAAARPALAVEIDREKTEGKTEDKRE